MPKQFLLKHCEPNPTLEYADSIEIPEGTDEIVAQGGGSTLDVGKWLKRKFNLPLVAIPTTAGTGSEVTKFCVLTVDGKKKTFTDEEFIPDAYVLDATLLRTLPDEQLIFSALDAFSQALEASWSLNKTDESGNYASMAINLILGNLLSAKRIFWKDNYRMNLLIGANFSGRAINITKTNVCHAISYPLTERYGIPHGMACAMSLRYFAKKAIKLDLTDLFHALDLPKYEIDAEKIADEVMGSEKLKDFPFPVERRDIVMALTT